MVRIHHRGKDASAVPQLPRFARRLPYVRFDIFGPGSSAGRSGRRASRERRAGGTPVYSMRNEIFAFTRKRTIFFPSTFASKFLM
jgi:hypothetical protein